MRLAHVLILSCFFSTVWAKEGIWKGYLNTIKALGEIIDVTTNSPTTYYQAHDGQFAGIEYDMAAAFARSLGVKPRYVVKNTIADVLEAVSTGQGDFAAAGILKPAKPDGKLIYGPDYQWVQQQTICHRDNYNFPSSINTIGSSDFWVAPRTSYLFRLKQLKATHPDLTWQVKNDWDTELLLKKVSGKASLCTVADSNIFAVIIRR